jgi:hypothetical protein
MKTSNGSITAKSIVIRRFPRKFGMYQTAKGTGERGAEEKASLQ